MFNSVDWQGVFIIDTPLLETFVRGTCVYIALFLMLRFVMKRQTGGIGVTDVLVIVMIADASQNAMAGEYTSIIDGILLVAVILFWDFVINWLSFHVPWFAEALDPKPVQLIKHGRIMRTNLKRELITIDELDAQLRLQGVDDHKNVKCAFMESDGKISVVTYGAKRAKAQKRRKKNGVAT